MTATLLIDNSARARLGDPALDEQRVAELADALKAGRLATCLPFLLRAGYSPRNARDHDQLLHELLTNHAHVSPDTRSLGRMTTAHEIEFVFAAQDKGGYHVYAPELPGLHTQGDSVEEATENARQALALYVEGLSEDDRSLDCG